MLIRRIDADVLIIGGGMAGCGAAYEARKWGKNLKIIIAEKANIDRSGAVAMGLSAINTYLGMRWNENTPEDYVRYVRGDLMGIVREDLVYDIGRHVDSSVHLFEEWGLPIIKSQESGRYLREGRWQVLIHGESYKPIVAEAAKKAATEVINRVMVTHLLKDTLDKDRVVGAVGFDVRDGSMYVFRSRVTILAAGGATHIFRPRSVGEGWGRTWYSPWSSGSAYSLAIEAGAKMVQMEIRLVPTRFKDGYGPVGAWFLHIKSKATNAYNESYDTNRDKLRKKYGKYADAKPMPTCLRNDLMIDEIREGKFPIIMHTEHALDTKEKEEAGWEDFLDMTVSQAMVWASQNIDPKEKPSELVPTEPYIMGSHAVNAGAWVSGPGGIAPDGYYWGYNRMTTLRGLFAAGDAAGGAAHKFSSGSFTEGRIAGKSAVKFLRDNEPKLAEIDGETIERYKTEIFQPLENYELGRSFLTPKGIISPHYLVPPQGLKRLEKIMDEYSAGISSNYTTNAVAMKRGLELLDMLQEDLQLLGAEDLHQLQRAWELHHRVMTAQAVMRHTLFREETRWPGYYYRSDFPRIDDESWRAFVVSRYDASNNSWTLEKVPLINIIGE